MTTIKEQPSGRVLLLRWEGPLDGSSPAHPTVSAHVLCRGERLVILDTTHAPYADSDGLRWLIRLQREVQASGKRLRIAAVRHGKVWRNLTLIQAGLDLHESVAAAWHIPWILPGDAALASGNVSLPTDDMP